MCLEVQTNISWHHLVHSLFPMTKRFRLFQAIFWTRLPVRLCGNLDWTTFMERVMGLVVSSMSMKGPAASATKPLPMNLWSLAWSSVMVRHWEGEGVIDDYLCNAQVQELTIFYLYSMVWIAKVWVLIFRIPKQSL